MIEVRAFEPGDLAALELQPQQEMEMGALPDWRDLGDMMQGAGPAWERPGRRGGYSAGMILAG